MPTGQLVCLECESSTLAQLVRVCWARVSLPTNEQVLNEVAIRTNLSIEACQELLDGGWTYIETLNGLPRWELNPK